MLERLVEQRKAITAASVELDVPLDIACLTLHASHTGYWVLAEEVVKVLQVYEEATREQVVTMLLLLLLFQL